MNAFVKKFILFVFYSGGNSHPVRKNITEQGKRRIKRNLPDQREEYERRNTKT